MSLATASIWTLGLLGGMVFAILTAALYSAGITSPALSIGLTIAFAFIWWGLSPIVMDWSLRLANRLDWIEDAEFRAEYPELHAFIRRVCDRHRVKMPRLGIIRDQTPTAFTYGSTAQNARLVVSEGLFDYLEPEEVQAVYAHELGHIVHRDFIVMALGATLVQVLYQVYVILTKRRGGNGKNNLAYIGLAAYVFYILGTYLLRYLSRTREYMADAFSAAATRNPNALAMALTKIAYGVLEAEQKGASKQLIESTRALGIFDPKGARNVGVAVVDGLNLDKVGRVFLFDLFNPWASIAEWHSTHPLTGKRIRALATQARKLGLEPPFDFPRIAAAGNKLDKMRMRLQFLREAGLYFGPWVGAVACLAIAFSLDPRLSLAGIIAGLGLGALAKGYYSFRSTAAARPRTFLDLMTDPYASPLKGLPVRLSGRLIGRASAGSIASEDFMLQDSTGVVYLNYESLGGPLGNLFFAFTRADDLIGDEVEAVGWFRRGAMPQFDLLKMHTSGGRRIRSWTRAWAMIPGGLLVLAGLVVAAFSV